MRSPQTIENIERATGLNLSNVAILPAMQIEELILQLDEALEDSDDANLRDDLASCIDALIRIHDLRFGIHRPSLHGGLH